MNCELKYMRRAIDLAHKGAPNVSPNPLVGAVIVDSQGNILGEGYHRKYGEAHAEVNAINAVKDKSALRDSTMYVTLEPCAHQGKTPPCADLIIRMGIPRVVIGSRDPFEKVNGAGIERLREAGIDVEVGILEKECRKINAIFFTAHTLHRPFIILKWARSADGFLDIKRGPFQKAPLISSPRTRLMTHHLRAFCDGILVGSGTVLADDPILDCRLWPGSSPRPIILDRRGRVDSNYKIWSRDPIIIKDDKPLSEILTDLYNKGLTSVLVEGGTTVLSSFLQERLWDVIRIEIGPFDFGDLGSVKSPIVFGMEPIKVSNIEGHIVKYYSQNPLFDVKNL